MSILILPRNSLHVTQARFQSMLLVASILTFKLNTWKLKLKEKTKNTIFFMKWYIGYGRTYTVSYLPFHRYNWHTIYPINYFTEIIVSYELAFYYSSSIYGHQFIGLILWNLSVCPMEWQASFARLPCKASTDSSVRAGQDNLSGCPKVFQQGIENIRLSIGEQIPNLARSK